MGRTAAAADRPGLDRAVRPCALFHGVLDVNVTTGFRHFRMVVCRTLSGLGYSTGTLELVLKNLC